MSRISTPPPSRVTRAGTFDGMEKLFFDNAAAIEAGEQTAPPEVTGVPPTFLREWLGKLQALALYQKIGLGLGVLTMTLGAVLVFGGGKSANKVVPPTAPKAIPTAAGPATPAPVVKTPSKPAVSSHKVKRRSPALKRRAVAVKKRQLR